jgi:hypothetical protein
MGRYQIAVKQMATNVLSNAPLQFPGTTSISKMVKFINYCIKHRSALKAPDTPTHVLESAIIKVSQLNDVPIIVASKDEAMMLSLVYSHQEVFSPENLPKEGSWVICYNCTLPLNFKPYISIFSK